MEGWSDAARVWVSRAALRGRDERLKEEYKGSLKIGAGRLLVIRVRSETGLCVAVLNSVRVQDYFCKLSHCLACSEV